MADRIGLSKSGVFSRVGSREALQKAVIEEFGRRFLADVFVPAMQMPKGLPRLDDIVQRWIVRTRDVDAENGCIYSAGAFELDDREGPLRDLLHSRGHALARRAAPHRAAGHRGRPPEARHRSRAAGRARSTRSILGLMHDARFLRDPRAAERAQATWQPPAADLPDLESPADMSSACQFVHISHDRAKKGIAMFTLLILAALYGGWRVVRAALESLRGLPRSNDDMIFYLRSRAMTRTALEATSGLLPGQPRHPAVPPGAGALAAPLARAGRARRLSPVRHAAAAASGCNRRTRLGRELAHRALAVRGRAASPSTRRPSAPHGPVALLVHGWGGHAGQMLALAEALAQQGLRPGAAGDAGARPQRRRA